MPSVDTARPDVLYLVRLADVAGVDLDSEAVAKLARDESRYPAD